MQWTSLPSASRSHAQTRRRLIAGRDCFTEPQIRLQKANRWSVLCVTVKLRAFFSHILSGVLFMADLKDAFQAPLDEWMSLSVASTNTVDHHISVVTCGFCFNQDILRLIGRFSMELKSYAVLLWCLKLFVLMTLSFKVCHVFFMGSLKRWLYMSLFLKIVISHFTIKSKAYICWYKYYSCLFISLFVLVITCFYTERKA